MNWRIRLSRNKQKKVVGVSVVPEPELRVSKTLKFDEDYVEKLPDLTSKKSMKLAYESIHAKPYVEPTHKEIIEGLEFCDNYEAAYLITSLKKENMILKGKLTKLTKKYEACEADRLMYIQQLNHLHGHGETE